MILMLSVSSFSWGLPPLMFGMGTDRTNCREIILKLSTCTMRGLASANLVWNRMVRLPKVRFRGPTVVMVKLDFSPTRNCSLAST